MPASTLRSPLHLLGVAGLCVLLGCSSSKNSAPATVTGSSGDAVKQAESRTATKSHVQSGREALARGLYDEAEREFRLALETEPGNEEALAGLGQVQVKHGNYSDAVPTLERATHTTSQMVSAFRSLGDAYAALGQTEKAATAYRQAVALTPGDVGARLALAGSLTEIGEYDEAAAICQSTLRMAKGQPSQLAATYRQIGEVHAHKGNTPEAMSAYYRAAELDPENKEIVRGVASTAVKGGLYAEAASALSRVLLLAPLDVAAKKQLAWVNFKLERYPNAIHDYEAVADSLGTADRYYLAQAYAKSSKVDRAVELYRQVAAQDPQNYKGVYCNMAYAYYEANRYQRAIDVAREGLKDDSTSACLRFCWAQALDKMGKHDEAIPVFETVLADPAYAESAKRELERQRRIVKLLKTKERGN
ncbi:MAG TPA: tetratricopeptide repeat protein [Candidatus Eisenbacteria bacterium]|nr:tetratricopeptide repeat protein [Candidatus Eisenbacteria bacterium]